MNKEHRQSKEKECFIKIKYKHVIPTKVGIH